ncbi:hypothetical protein E1B28_011099 [Marasmius oreades]|uniref:Uncharacterized protein n=1 Tax=Marasmius oreades TaxID=181124 RepID=A0A9P7RTC6_9AGAR|nr:uncharacterized protein E1B28_011099 [Marasmius oreades]KAG7089411.1 hypothetical protein E1B28_011099 [Marasmius oreades]
MAVGSIAELSPPKWCTNLRKPRSWHPMQSLGSKLKKFIGGERFPIRGRTLEDVDEVIIISRCSAKNGVSEPILGFQHGPEICCRSSHDTERQERRTRTRDLSHPRYSTRAESGGERCVVNSWCEA